jgi:SAM-dependent methyltransferase
LFCESARLTTILDLGLHPFADTFLKEEDLPKGERVYPLICDLCDDCGQVQLRCITDPDDRYTNHDYSYTSSNSAFARKHWDAYAQEVAERISLQGGLVVEAGSNDGYLAEQFAKRGNTAIGVDPSPYMAKLAEARGVKTRVALFGKSVAEQILREHGNAELIVANNVFNHSDNPVDFAKAAAELLAPNGTFVFEMPYWLISIRSRKFDQIYHEHVSYFSVTSAESVLRRAGLAIFAAEVVDYHGGSLRVYAKHAARVHACPEAESFKREEREFGLFDHGMYRRFMKELLAMRASFLEEVYRISARGGIIIAVGAAAKGNTLLNFYNLDHKTIHFVTDASEHKQGKYTPYTRIPIRPDAIFAQYDPVHALILSWNLSDGLKQALAKIQPNISFISPWQVNT